MFAILVAVAAILLTLISIKSYFTKWRYIEQIPGPKTLPIIGNAHQVGSNPHDFFHNLLRWWHEYGKDIHRIWVGHIANVNISNPKDIESVLSSTVILKKSPNYELLHSWLGEGLLTSFGSKWHKRRKMITPSFHFKILTEFFEVMNRNSDKFMEKLAAISTDGKIVDIQDETQYFTLDVICDTAMGVSINAMDNHDSDVVKAFKNMCFLILERTFKLLKRYDFLYQFAPEYKLYKWSLKVLREFTKEVVEKRKRVIEAELKGETAPDAENIKIKKAFLDTLLTAKVDNQPLSFQDIFEEVSTFMFEGHDTTTSGIAFAVYLLSRHPKIQEKVFEEQKSLFADDLKRTPTYQDVQEMQYLEMVVKEAQRMYPSVPMIARTPTDYFNMNGKIIPPGTSINLFIFVMGYNEKYFPDPYKFDPERFNPDASTEKSNPYQYVPFSAGPRNCIGQKFAMLELKSVLSKIVRNFEILPAKDELVSKDGYEKWNQSEYDPKLFAVLTLKSDNGVLIRLRPRSN